MDYASVIESRPIREEGKAGLGKCCQEFVRVYVQSEFYNRGDNNEITGSYDYIFDQCDENDWIESNILMFDV